MIVCYIYYILITILDDLYFKLVKLLSWNQVLKEE